MKKFIFSIFVIIITVFVSLLFTNVALFASEQNTTKTTLMITIQPVRILVVDKDLIIQKIYSNTTVDIRPIVTLNTSDGTELPYSDAIQKEYQFLKPSLNFSNAGFIYERDNRPIQALLKRASRTVSKFFFF